ncbi:MAG: SIMPL domain-containing protein [Nanoarchaeota archaeon]|nr:SIMPL domain-containing protein [Nanoarchaeota archaeon]
MANQLNKNVVFVTIAVLLVAVIALFLFYGNKGTTITTDGSAEMNIMPEKVVIYISTQTIDKSAETAKNTNSEIVENVINALMQEGFTKEEIETEQYNIYPNYDWKTGRQIITGYTVSQNMKISLTDFDKTGKIVDAVVDNGALISYINFEISKQKENELKAELLKDATANARLKADSIAQGLGKRVSGVVSVSTSDYGYYSYPIYRAEASGTDELQKAVTDIQPKQLELNAMVSVTFRIS